MSGVKATGHLLKQLRQYMKDTKYVTEAVYAYIIPSGDAHQVSWSCWQYLLGQWGIHSPYRLSLLEIIIK